MPSVSDICLTFILVAACDFEGRDVSVPVEGAAAEEVLVGVPEGAVVDWVDGHGAVVSPTIEVTQLRTRACENKLF